MSLSATDCQLQCCFVPLLICANVAGPFCSVLWGLLLEWDLLLNKDRLQITVKCVFSFSATISFSLLFKCLQLQIKPENLDEAVSDYFQKSKAPSDSQFWGTEWNLPSLAFWDSRRWLFSVFLLTSRAIQISFQWRFPVTSTAQWRHFPRWNF